MRSRVVSQWMYRREFLTTGAGALGALALLGWVNYRRTRLAPSLGEPSPPPAPS